MDFFLCSAHEKALSEWHLLDEIVAVISSVAVMPIDFPPNTYTLTWHKKKFIA